MFLLLFSQGAVTLEEEHTCFFCKGTLRFAGRDLDVQCTKTRDVANVTGGKEACEVQQTTLWSLADFELDINVLRTTPYLQFFDLKVKSYKSAQGCFIGSIKH